MEPNGGIDSDDRDFNGLDTWDRRYHVIQATRQHAQFLHECAGVHSLLSQDDFWPVDGKAVPIAMLEGRHILNIIDYFKRNAAQSEFMYSFAEVYFIGNINGEMARMAVEANLEQAWEERTNDPIKWVMETPAMKMMVKLAEVHRKALASFTPRFKLRDRTIQVG